LVPVSGACPRLELTVSIEEGVEYLRNQNARVHSLAVNVLIVLSVTLEGGVQVAGEHDAYLNGAKGPGEACELHMNLQNCRVELPL
jgi:hypothetical protein